jgi:uncharacterized membrane protein (DUF373 family)
VATDESTDEHEGPPAQFADTAEDIMRYLELGAAYFLVALFAIGVFDLGRLLLDLLVSGSFTDVDAVIDLIDTVLVLLIIVEVFQTVIAFSRDEPVIRIVINAALIAIARKVISFRFSEFNNNYEQALIGAASFALLLGVLIAAFYVIRKSDPQPAGYEEVLAGKFRAQSDDDEDTDQDHPPTGGPLSSD